MPQNASLRLCFLKNLLPRVRAGPCSLWPIIVVGTMLVRDNVVGCSLEKRTTELSRYILELRDGRAW